MLRRIQPLLPMREWGYSAEEDRVTVSKERIVDKINEIIERLEELQHD